jgi:hypothetical protein
MRARAHVLTRSVSQDVFFGVGSLFDGNKPEEVQNKTMGALVEFERQCDAFLTQLVGGGAPLASPRPPPLNARARACAQTSLEDMYDLERASLVPSTLPGDAAAAASAATAIAAREQLNWNSAASMAAVMAAAVTLPLAPRPAAQQQQQQPAQGQQQQQLPAQPQPQQQM